MTRVEKGLFGDQPVKIARYKIALARNIVRRLVLEAEKIATGDRKHRRGGFQDWVMETVTRLAIVSGELDADDCYIGKTYRYSLRYGEGGWQEIFRAILNGMGNSDLEVEL